MRTEEFHRWILRAKELTSSQRKQAIARLTQPASETTLEDLLEPVTHCPLCRHTHFSRWGKSHGVQRYRCRGCGATFNELTGTPLAGLRHKDRWLDYAATMLEGQSVRKAARACGVDKNTAFRWRHRFLTIPALAKARHLQGIVEADETYFLESHKGERHLNRPPRKRGGVASQPGLSKEQVPVLIARDRSGHTTDSVLPQANTRALKKALGPVVDKDAVLCSDGNKIYRSFAAKMGITHKPLNLRAGVRVVDKAFHIQNVNAYDSRLKGWMLRFHGVATKYLPNYLGWRRLLERHLTEINPRSFFAEVTGVANI